MSSFKVKKDQFTNAIKTVTKLSGNPNVLTFKFAEDGFLHVIGNTNTYVDYKVPFTNEVKIDEPKHYFIMADVAKMLSFRSDNITISIKDNQLIFKGGNQFSIYSIDDEVPSVPEIPESKSIKLSLKDYKTISNFIANLKFPSFYFSNDLIYIIINKNILKIHLASPNFLLTSSIKLKNKYESVSIIINSKQLKDFITSSKGKFSMVLSDEKVRLESDFITAYLPLLQEYSEVSLEAINSILKNLNGKPSIKVKTENLIESLSKVCSIADESAIGDFVFNHEKGTCTIKVESTYGKAKDSFKVNLSKNVEPFQTVLVILDYLVNAIVKITKDEVISMLIPEGNSFCVIKSKNEDILMAGVVPIMQDG